MGSAGRVNFLTHLRWLLYCALIFHTSAVAQTWLPAPLQIVATSPAQGGALLAAWQHAGFRVQAATPADFRAAPAGGFWWITAAAAEQLGPDVIRASLQKGAWILLDGSSRASQSLLGLRSGGGMLRQARMRGLGVAWDADIPDWRPSVPGQSLATTLQGTPALFQAGHLLWSLPRLDLGLGPQRLPYLPQVLSERWGLNPQAERHDLDLYVDPDLLTGSATLQQRLRQWKASGVQRVYLAAWKEDQTRGYTYPYAGFLSAAHDAGIEVYAWLAWPHVSLGFWKQHPDCREQTAAGTPAHIFWREHVALGVPRCFDLAWAATSKLLNRFAFDGVNVAELYFESPAAGPSDPSQYTPMHPELRQVFARQAGFDPAALFNPKNPLSKDAAAWKRWTLFRQTLLTELHAKLLGRLRTLKSGRHLMVTLIDDRLDASISGPLIRNIGLDVAGVLALRKQGAFQVQVEDPYLLWATGPGRYARLGSLYPEVKPADLLLDINVVDRDAWPKGLSTRRLSGFEFDEAVSAAGSGGASVVLYAASTVLEADLGWMRFALAGQSVQLQEHDGQLQSSSPKPFWLRLDQDATKATLDGQPLKLVGPRLVPVPAGTHVLRLE